VHRTLGDLPVSLTTNFRLSSFREMMGPRERSLNRRRQPFQVLACAHQPEHLAHFSAPQGCLAAPGASWGQTRDWTELQVTARQVKTLEAFETGRFIARGRLGCSIKSARGHRRPPTVGPWADATAPLRKKKLNKLRKRSKKNKTPPSRLISR